MNVESINLLAVGSGRRLFFQRRRTGFGERIFGQHHRTCLELIESLMPLLLNQPTALCSVKHYTQSRIPTDRQILPVGSKVMFYE
jgi:hypothetical protein